MPNAPSTPAAPRPSSAPDVPPWRAWTAPGGLALGFAFGGLATIFVDIIAQAGGSSLKHPPPAVSIVGDVVFDLGFVVAALYLASLKGFPGTAAFGFRRVGVWLGVRTAVIAALSYYVLTAVYSAVFHLHGNDKLPSELGAEHSTAALVAASIFVCVVAPIAEEFFFRGFLFGALRQMRIPIAGHDLGTWVAALITGILFGLAHLGSASLQYLIPLGFLGFVLCLIRWRTCSLYPCMALHGLNNALALGVNQLAWSALGIVGLVFATWLAIAVITGPIGWRNPALAQ